jgi:hypothetical protein
MKEVQAAGEAFSLQKRTSSTSIFSILVGHFCPSGPDKADQNQCGPGSIYVQIRRFRDLITKLNSYTILNQQKQTMLCLFSFQRQQKAFFFMYVIQHYFICRPSESTQCRSEDARIKPKTANSCAHLIYSIFMFIDLTSE